MTKRLPVEITPDPLNANKGTERGDKLLEDSLRSYGAGRSVLVDKHGTLIAGNKTYQKAQELGLGVQMVDTTGDTLVIVRRTDLDLDDIAAQELAIADNRVGEVSLSWNTDSLAALFENGVARNKFWSETEIDQLYANAEQEAQAIDGDLEPDESAEPPAEPVTKPGDLWRLGRHRLMCGSSTDPLHLATLLDGTAIDCVYADPPYGINVAKTGGAGRDGATHRNEYRPIANDDTTDAARDFYALICNVPTIILWGANYYADGLPSGTAWIVWDKETVGDVYADCELAWTNKPGRVRMFRHQWHGMIKASEHGEARVHPTQKPVALAEWCLSEYAPDARTILDGFGGSGSTMLACEHLNRSSYTMELDAGYCDVIIDRWESATGGTATRG